MTSTITRPRAALAALGAGALLLGSVWGATAASAAAPYDGKRVLQEGHADLLYIEKNSVGDPRLVIHSDEFGNHPADEFVMHVKPSLAHRTAGANVAAVLGVPTGATYYLAPQNNQQGQLFLGFGYNTTDYPANSINVKHEISDFKGPGTFAVWQNSDEGPVPFLNTRTAKFDFSSIANHEHVNWGFTAEGEYTFTVKSSFDQGGTHRETAPVKYTFFVGEKLPTGDPATPTPPATLTLTGVADHYHTGNVASLTARQNPSNASDHFHWFTRANAEAEWKFVDGAFEETYGFVVTRDIEVKAAIYGENHEVLAETAPAKIHLDDHGNTPGVGPELRVSLAKQEGALAISVAPEATRTQLTPMKLNDAADRYISEGEIKGITVTDTRSGNHGWNANGRVRDMVTVNGSVLDGKYLGWTPKVISASAGQAVTAGPVVATGFASGSGVKSWALLGSAGDKSIGTAVLGAQVKLEAPTTTEVGDYSGVMLITVI